MLLGGVAGGGSGQATLLASGAGTWTVPVGFDAANNTIELIGAGGAGQNAGGPNAGACGGGGQYAKLTNYNPGAPGSLISYRVGTAGGARGTAASPGSGDSWFNSASATAYAQCGDTGGSTSPSPGGDAAAVGSSVTANGGTGASGNSTHYSAGGGGGAGGPNGAGKAGGGAGGAAGDGGGGGGAANNGSVGAARSGATGGSGGNNRLAAGGGAGGATGVAGSNGTAGGGGGGGGYNTRGGNGSTDAMWGLYGPGSGAGGGANGTTLGGTGGAYGGGGGGGGWGGGTGGPGGQGIIVITWGGYTVGPPEIPGIPSVYSYGRTYANLLFADAAQATSHEYRLNGGAAVVLASNKVITGLSVSTFYSIEVRGVNAYGNGPWSTSVSITTTATWAPGELFLAGEKGFYFDPTDPVNLATNSDGTGTVASSGDLVGMIRDLSPNGNHATQGTSGLRALYNVAGAVKSLLFDGITNSRYYNLPSTLETGWTSGMMLYALKIANDPVAAERRGGPVVGQSGSDTASDHHPWTDGQVYNGFMSTARKTCGNPAQAMTAWHQGEFRSAAGAWGFVINGTNVFTTATNTVATSTVPLVGKHVRNRGDGGLLIDGNLGRMIMLDRVLTGTELTDARTWITASY